MQKIYSDTRILDECARNSFEISEDIMMENAAAALEAEVTESIACFTGHYISRPTVLVLCGSGNNGGDGYALARRLISHDISVTVCEVFEAKSPMCVLQKNRAKKSGASFISLYELDDFLAEASFDLRAVVDCIFGSGFHGELPYEAKAVINSINKENDCKKIACDIPSGNFFKADVTVTMGALKVQLFSDEAKDMCGKIKVCNLGISRSSFENAAGVIPEAYLLEEKDLTLPFRKKQNVHKGTFGHSVIVSGEKTGASVIAATAALKTGSGLVTVTDKSGELKTKNIPFELMMSEEFPENTTAAGIGMGLGKENEYGKKYLEYLTDNPDICAVLDADVLSSSVYVKEVESLLKSRKEKNNIIVTPHPKEFANLLKNLGDGEYSVKEITENRISLAKEFCCKYEGVTLILKGANVLIAQKMPEENKPRVYINPLGTNALAKAGSGDVLAGVAVSFMAQKQLSLEAAVNASLAHSIASAKCEKNYSLTPFDLINYI